MSIGGPHEVLPPHGFLDLNVSDEPFDASSFSKNRERLLAYDVSRAFFAEVVAEARQRRLLSADHFTVDGALLEAWVSLKNYRPRDEQDPPVAGGRNPEVDFRGQRRRRETHASSTDPQAGTRPSGTTIRPTRARCPRQPEPARPRWSAGHRVQLQVGPVAQGAHGGDLRPGEAAEEARFARLRTVERR